jgi:hypothetical protein
MGGQQKNYISDIVFFQHQDGMRKKVRQHFLQCINLSQIYECRNWETELYNSGLEITVSFLGIHKWEPAIYIGFSPALQLQCEYWSGIRDKGQA